MPKINFAGVSDLVALPEDNYDAKLDSWEWVDASKNKSGEYGYLKLTFVCTDDEHDGRKLFRNLSSSPTALWAMKRALIRLGADPEDLADDDGIDLDDLMPELIGAECVLRVAVREYEGEQVNDVKEIRQAALV